MPTVPSGAQFIGIASSQDLSGKRSALINKEQDGYNVDEIRGYKVYTALLNQTGILNPEPIVLYNSIGTISWQRFENKTLFLTFPEPLDVRKLYINNSTAYLGSYSIGNTLYDFSGTPAGQVLLYADSPTDFLTAGIAIDVYNNSNQQVEFSSMVSYFPIEIRLYY